MKLPHFKFKSPGYIADGRSRPSYGSYILQYFTDAPSDGEVEIELHIWVEVAVEKDSRDCPGYEECDINHIQTPDEKPYDMDNLTDYDIDSIKELAWEAHDYDNDSESSPFYSDRMDREE